MDLTGSSSYSVAASNTGTRIINLSGEYNSNIDYSDTVIYYSNSGSESSPSTASSYLPFGGFPGTEKYGR
jgi:hypothetical protein